MPRLASGLIVPFSYHLSRGRIQLCCCCCKYSSLDTSTEALYRPETYHWHIIYRLHIMSCPLLSDLPTLVQSIAIPRIAPEKYQYTKILKRVNTSGEPTRKHTVGWRKFEMAVRGLLWQHDIETEQAIIIHPSHHDLEVWNLPLLHLVILQWAVTTF